MLLEFYKNWKAKGEKMQFFNLPCGKDKINLSIPDNIKTKIIKPREVPVINPKGRIPRACPWMNG